MGVLQERITSTRGHSIPSLQAIYVPADDITDPSPHDVRASGRRDRPLARHRRSASTGRGPAGLLVANPRPRYVGDDHYAVAGKVQTILQRYKDCRTYRDPRRRTVQDKDHGEPRAIQRFLSQPFFVAEQFTASGKYAGGRDDLLVQGTGGEYDLRSRPSSGRGIEEAEARMALGVRGVAMALDVHLVTPSGRCGPARQPWSSRAASRATSAF
jgi:F-type H+-transporting ATPase subunit beta